MMITSAPPQIIRHWILEIGDPLFSRLLFHMIIVCLLSRSICVQLFATLWTIAREAPLFMRFPRQEYWSGLPFPPSGDFPDPGIEPTPPASPALQILYH